MGLRTVCIDDSSGAAAQAGAMRGRNFRKRICRTYRPAPAAAVGDRSGRNRLPNWISHPFLHEPVGGRAQAQALFPITLEVAQADAGLPPGETVRQSFVRPLSHSAAHKRHLPEKGAAEEPIERHGERPAGS
jgi:hypothetical protein